MTSKEALKELKNNFGLSVIGRSLCEIIEQDLGKLEKYKKAIEILKGRICVHNQYICYDAYADIRLEDNEIELLEEVL